MYPRGLVFENKTFAHVEAVHAFFLKKFLSFNLLSVNQMTTNDLIILLTRSLYQLLHMPYFYFLLLLYPSLSPF